MQGLNAYLRRNLPTYCAIFWTHAGRIGEAYELATISSFQRSIQRHSDEKKYPQEILKDEFEKSRSVQAARCKSLVRGVGRGGGCPWPPLFVSHVLSKQPTTGGKNLVKILATPLLVHEHDEKLIRPWLHEVGTNSDRCDFKSVSMQMLVSVYMKLVWTIISCRFH